MKTSDISASEFNAYYGHYINLAKELDLVEGLQTSFKETMAFFGSLPQNKLAYRYAEGKWTIKEIFRHLIDTERVFAYRAMCFARNDGTSLPGFDQDEYVKVSMANDQTMDSLIEEYKSNRMSTVIMFTNFSNDMLAKVGNANNSKMSVRAAGFILIGHEKHHCNVIRELYL